MVYLMHGDLTYPGSLILMHIIVIPKQSTLKIDVLGQNEIQVKMILT